MFTVATSKHATFRAYFNLAPDQHDPADMRPLTHITFLTVSHDGAHMARVDIYTNGEVW